MFMKSGHIFPCQIGVDFRLEVSSVMFGLAITKDESQDLLKAAYSEEFCGLC